jgi:hypothetical protein
VSEMYPQRCFVMNWTGLRSIVEDEAAWGWTTNSNERQRTKVSKSVGTPCRSATSHQ